MKSRIRVLLVDDNDDYLQGMSAWLTEGARLDIVGRARTGEDALLQVESLSPDLVLTDLSMQGMNGFEVARQIKMRPGAPRVVMVTFHDSETLRLEAFAAGADGLVDKAKVTERLIPVIRSLFPDEDEQLFPKRAGTGPDRGKTIEPRLSSKPGPPRDFEG
jgi:DNA-binding NarL/FixJ family response regulator